MRTPENLVGAVFGRLTVIEKASPYISPSGQKRVRWLCKCNCGGDAVVGRDALVKGVTQSCGCLQKERAGRSNKRHGLSKSKIWNIWSEMHQRCGNPKNKGFKHYGGRGITVCEEWATFENFYRDMGAPPEGLSLERINNDLGYSAANCKWATIWEQALNRRRSSCLGEQRPNAKLNAHAVAAIRQKCLMGIKQTDLAAEYGVAKSLIGRIATGQSWKHVP